MGKGCTLNYTARHHEAKLLVNDQGNVCVQVERVVVAPGATERITRQVSVCPNINDLLTQLGELARVANIAYCDGVDEETTSYALTIWPDEIDRETHGRTSTTRKRVPNTPSLCKGNST